jgi:hypothetical protein
MNLAGIVKEDQSRDPRQVYKLERPAGRSFGPRPDDRQAEQSEHDGGYIHRMRRQRVPVSGRVRLRPSLVCFDIHKGRWFDTTPQVTTGRRASSCDWRSVSPGTEISTTATPSRQELFRFLRSYG